MWKPLKNFEENFKVSDKGEIVKLYDNREHTIKQFLSKHNGMVIRLNVKDKSYLRSVGRLVLESFTGKTGRYANHKDGNPMNNSIENLEWVDKKPPSMAIKVYCRELNKIFQSISAAMRETNITKRDILYSCETRKPFRGYTFSYMSKPSKNRMVIRNMVENLPDEEWKYLEGSDNQFMISNMGRVKSIERVWQNKLGQTWRFNEKLVKIRLQENRAMIHINIKSPNGRKRKMFTIAKEVFRHFINPKNVKLVKHIDKDEMNNCVDNLFVEK